MTAYHLLLLLLCSCFGAAGEICVKQYDLRAGKIQNGNYVFNLILSLVSIVCFLITGVSTAGGLTFRADVFGYAVLRAVGYIMGSVGYLAAVHTGPLLLSVVISRMGNLIPIFYSILFLEEEVTPLTVFGALLLFTALVLFNCRKKGGVRRAGLRFWVFVFLSFTGNGIAMLAIKVQQFYQPGLYQSEILFYSMAIVSIFFLGAVLVFPPRAPEGGRAGRIPAALPESPKACRGSGRYADFFPLFFTGAIFAVLYGICNAMGNYIGTTVISHLPAIVYYTFSTGLGILLSFLVARGIYREKLGWLQYLGCGIAAVGLFLLTSPGWV